VGSVARPSNRIPTLAFVLPIALSCAALLLRTLSIAQPLGIDQGLWASAVRGLDRGQKLYVDVWEQRPPGIYLTYWLAFTVLGWKAATVSLLDVIASTLTTGSLYVLARKLTGPTAGALTAALYAVLTMPAWLYGAGGFLERSVSETFIVNCICLAALCAVAHRQRNSLVAAFGFGTCLGAAVIFKPNAALYFPALLLWMLLPKRGGDRTSPTPFGTAATALMGATVLPVAVLIWLWQTGALPEAKKAVIDFNRWYVGVGFDPAEYAVLFSKAVWLRVKTDPLWLAGISGSAMAFWDLVRHRRLPDLPALGLLWGAAAALVIIVNGMRLFNSYFSQALAPLALIAGWWLSTGWSQSRWRRSMVAATVGLMVILAVWRGYVPRVAADVAADASVLLGRTSSTSYLERFGSYANGRGYSARANAELAQYVRAHTALEDRVFLFGINGASVYFLADRLTAHRFLRVNFFVPTEFPDPSFRLDTVVAELRQRRPVYLIFERLHSTADPAVAKTVDALPDDPIVRSLLADYTLETTIEDFTLYRLR
jgi:4-amino-4-deoxy-L-arabinose transferase-like glycosyltransferase